VTILIGYETLPDGRHVARLQVHQVEVSKNVYRPVDATKDAALETQTESGGRFLLDQLPEPPEELPRKSVVMVCDPRERRVWYEYEDRPATIEEELGDLRAALEAEESAKAERDTGLADALAKIDSRLKAIEDKLGIATKG
jgi:hypothetical protein